MPDATLHPTTGCPFCGAGPEKCYPEDVAGNEFGDAWTVICSACGANGPLNLAARSTPGIAIQQWDQRAPSKADRDLSQALNEGDGSYRP